MRDFITFLLILAFVVAGCSKPTSERHVTEDNFVVSADRDSPIGKAMLEEDYALAEELATELVHLQPDNADAFIALAQAQLMQMKYDDASTNFGIAVERDPDNGLAIYGCGLVAQEQEHFEEAKRYYERLLVLDPQSPEGHYGMAAACEGLELHTLVIQHGRRFLELASDSPLAAQATDMISLAQDASAP